MIFYFFNHSNRKFLPEIGDYFYFDKQNIFHLLRLSLYGNAIQEQVTEILPDNPDHWEWVKFVRFGHLVEIPTEQLILPIHQVSSLLTHQNSAIRSFSRQYINDLT